jgi:hypothetical protein
MPPSVLVSLRALRPHPSLLLLPPSLLLPLPLLLPLLPLLRCASGSVGVSVPTPSRRPA